MERTSVIFFSPVNMGLYSILDILGHPKVGNEQHVHRSGGYELQRWSSLGIGSDTGHA